MKNRFLLPWTWLISTSNNSSFTNCLVLYWGIYASRVFIWMFLRAEIETNHHLSKAERKKSCWTVLSDILNDDKYGRLSRPAISCWSHTKGFSLLHGDFNLSKWHISGAEFRVDRYQINLSRFKCHWQAFGEKISLMRNSWMTNYNPSTL